MRCILSGLRKFILVILGFEESRQDRIVLQGIDGSALQLLIDYVYTAEVLVTEENVQVCWCTTGTNSSCSPLVM